MVGWEGGEVVPNNGNASYGSAEVIMNPTVVTYEVQETLTLPVSQITPDPQTGRDTVMINELQCWDYSDQAEGAMDDFWEAILGGVERALEPQNKTQPASPLQ